MTWVKTCDKTYKKTGFKQPVFLWNDLGKKRVFIDVPKGVKVDIQYCYDKVDLAKENDSNVKWHNYETGTLENDFAFEVIGITALRCNIRDDLEVLKQISVNLSIYQNNEMETI